MRIIYSFCLEYYGVLQTDIEYNLSCSAARYEIRREHLFTVIEHEADLTAIYIS